MRRLGLPVVALVVALGLPSVVPAQAPQRTKPQAAQQKTSKKPPAAKPDPAWLTPQQTAQRYQEAAKAESEGHHRHAFVAYLEAAENGHGEAQKKMGDIYSKHGPVVRRDYQTALQWYEKARAQGVPIPKPPAFTKGH